MHHSAQRTASSSMAARRVLRSSSLSSSQLLSYLTEEHMKHEARRVQTAANNLYAHRSKSASPACPASRDRLDTSTGESANIDKLSGESLAVMKSRSKGRAHRLQLFLTRPGSGCESGGGIGIRSQQPDAERTSVETTIEAIDMKQGRHVASHDGQTHCPHAYMVLSHE